METFEEAEALEEVLWSVVVKQQQTLLMDGVERAPYDNIELEVRTHFNRQR